MATIELVAHRGYASAFPENTLVSIAAALDCGARYIETDIQLTADGIPVLFHDRDLKRLCGKEGAIHDYKLAELQKFSVSYPGKFGDQFRHVRITRLADLVTLIRQRPKLTAFIELKRISLEKFGRGVVLDRVIKELTPVRDQCVLISFSLEVLLAARRRHWPRIGVVFDKWRERNQAIVADIKPDYIFCDVDGLPMWGNLYTGKTKVAVYEVDNIRKAIKLGKRGVDLVETFSIGELLPKLKQRS
jgi:glycerophosphoryl diester phosphodiesterase